MGAVASRDVAKAAQFAKEVGIKRSYGSYAEVLKDPDVAYIYIATPHTQHLGLIEAAAAVNKHILCEKPMCVTLSEGERAVAVCKKAGVALVENCFYRFNKQTRRLVEIVQSGSLGKLHRLSASFAFKCPPDEERLWSPELAGGGILDVGCYPVSAARLISSAIDGLPCSEPVAIDGSGLLTER